VSCAGLRKGGDGKKSTVKSLSGEERKPVAWS